MTEEQEKIFNDIMKEAKLVLDKSLKLYKIGKYNEAEPFCKHAIYLYEKAHEHAKFYESERQNDANDNLIICKNFLNEIAAMQRFEELHNIK